MAIFHMSAKAVARSQGKSATASAAYRSGERINDERTGEVHDYTKKQGVLHSEIVTHDGLAINRETLWNMAEAAEKRKDGTPGKEYEIALPDEVSSDERKRIALDFARRIAEQEKCVVDVCIHEPSRRGDNRNHHAHLLCTTRELTPSGTLGGKCAIDKSDRDRQKMGLSCRKPALIKLREMLAGIINAALERSGASSRVDHRTLSKQGIDREATRHKGVVAVNMERRGKIAERAAIERGISASEREEEMKALTEELSKLEREERAEARTGRREAARERLDGRRAVKAAEAEAAAKEVERRRQEAERREQQRREEAHRLEQQQREAVQRAREEAAKARRSASQGRGGR